MTLAADPLMQSMLARRNKTPVGMGGMRPEAAGKMPAMPAASAVGDFNSAGPATKMPSAPGLLSPPPGPAASAPAPGLKPMAPADAGGLSPAASLGQKPAAGPQPFKPPPFAGHGGFNEFMSQHTGSWQQPRRRRGNGGGGGAYGFDYGGLLNAGQPMPQFSAGPPPGSIAAGGGMATYGQPRRPRVIARPDGGARALQQRF